MSRLYLFLFVFVTTTLSLSQPVKAEALEAKVKTFKELEKIVKEVGKSELAKTLVVMDDDDTLTMMSCHSQKDPKDCQYLGGPAWYSWQESLLTTNSKYKVASNSQELLNIAAVLLAMNNMVYTEKEVPTVLQNLTKSGVKLLVLTARGSSNLSATASQFSKLSSNNLTNQKESFLDLINGNALNGSNSQTTSLASPFQPESCQAERPVSYQQGVMYVAGQNKGNMLLCLLNRTESKHIKHIVFIDDTLQNVKDVYQAFKDQKAFDVKALHYTALEQHKAALTVGKMAETYQQNAQTRWQTIKSALETELQKPATAY